MKKCPEREKARECEDIDTGLQDSQTPASQQQQHLLHEPVKSANR